MSFNCLECEQEFDSERSLHAHIKKHEIYLHDYFVKHFSRRNLLTNELLPFKNKESYSRLNNSINKITSNKSKRDNRNIIEEINTKLKEKASIYR